MATRQRSQDARTLPAEGAPALPDTESARSAHARPAEARAPRHACAPGVRNERRGAQVGFKIFTVEEQRERAAAAKAASDEDERRVREAFANAYCLFFVRGRARGDSAPSRQRAERAAMMDEAVRSAAPDVSKYLRLLSLGQPLEHVRGARARVYPREPTAAQVHLRMRADGMDPALLLARDPAAPPPPAGPAETQ